MTTTSPTLARRADVEAFVLQILRTGLMLSDLAADMLENVPEGAFPGEDPGQVIIECLCGSIAPAAQTAGLETVHNATMLIREAGERTIAHLRLALELKERGEA